ncbi:MAG: NAD(P)H-dependent oxidoreductase [Muribaculaceae bacterium]|nr:NAD(P)H-dependent oxidoreductase [Muribaculaceae bacterium]
MNKILVIAGHPDYKQSVANRAILDEFHRLVPEAEIVYLGAEYPDCRIDVDREQRRLREADTIVFEFPFWWYGAPSLMHSYMEAVLTYGFAYGNGGTALKGKRLIISFTTGAPAEAYSTEGYQKHPIGVFTAQFSVLAGLCNLTYGPEVISFGMAAPVPSDTARVKVVRERAADHARRLADAVKG